MRLPLFLGALLLPAAALALPQYAVRSARACDTCHADPTGWTNPELSERKCSLNCNICHVSPGGGGMRNESGLYYGYQVLPMFGSRPADKDYKPPALMNGGRAPAGSATAPASQPMVAASQPTVAASQPTVAASQPTAAGPKMVAAPGSAGRYGGIQPHPTFQIGADVRSMIYVPFEDHPFHEDTDGLAVFPMQLDIHLAVRPYNPPALNVGRLTLLATAGIEGQRVEPETDPQDRIFLKEYWAMYHDLPYQMYGRVGRFLPIHGWRTDDHTIFTRQGTNLLGLPFDMERQVTGLELGINPNYLYAHVSVFNPGDENLRFAGDTSFESPVDADAGWGSALAVGWRDLFWQAGASGIFGNRDDTTQWMASLQLALNFEVMWDFLPLIYLGEFHVHNQDRTGGDDTQTRLSAWHELGWLLTTGLNSKLRYEWADSDTEFKFDTVHRASAVLELHPYTWFTVLTSYRHNWTNNESSPDGGGGRFDFAGDEFFVQLHAWY